MAENENSEKIEKCMAEIDNEFDRYYQTVYLILSIWHFLNTTENCPVKYHMIEPTLKYQFDEEEKELRPDLTLLYDEETRGIAIEIKSSITNHELGAKREIKDVERYDKHLNGWRVVISDHSIVLAVHLRDSSRINRYINEMIQSNDLNFERNFALWEWSLIDSTKVGESGTGYLIRNITGSSGCEWLDNQVYDGIFVLENIVFDFYEERKFIRQRPPTIYTMVNLWCDVFPELCSITKEFSILTIQQIIDVIEKYYSTTWFGTSDHRLQIKESWIKEALEKLSEINLAEKVEEKEYRIFFKKNPRKDIKEYFIKKICEKQIKSIKEEKKEVEKGSLNDYMS